MDWVKKRAGCVRHCGNGKDLEAQLRLEPEGSWYDCYSGYSSVIRGSGLSKYNDYIKCYMLGFVQIRIIQTQVMLAIIILVSYGSK